MAFSAFGDTSTTINSKGKKISIGDISTMNKTLKSNLIFSNKNKKWYDSFNRFGCIDPLNGDTSNREFLFFTKPDLQIFDSSYNLVNGLEQYPIFKDAYDRNFNALKQLQYTYTNEPFIKILSNAVTSRLDLPGISAETSDSSANIYGTSIQYRGHSLKSDNGFDFTLSFTDTLYMEIYTIVKLYDEYMRLQKLGKVKPFHDHIVDRVLPEQFSVYKFIVGDDGETIIFWAKVTGVFFVDVPRSDFSDPGNDGFKYSLSFHGQFVEDFDPVIFGDFNLLTDAYKMNNSSGGVHGTVPTYSNGAVNNEWVNHPYVITDTSKSRRSKAGLGNYDYKLKWVN